MSRLTSPVLLRILVRLSIAYAIALALVLHTPFVDWFAYGLLTPTETPRGDAIVVLSAWASAAGELNESGLRRTLAAASAFKAGAAPRIVVTGSPPAPGHEEGDALQASVRLLRELGVPQEAIAVDGRAENTRASAINIARMAKEQRWSGIVLVTDATHMRRARMAFAHEGLSITSVSTMTWMIGGEKPSIRLAKLGAVLHEYVGLAYYRARGWV